MPYRAGPIKAPGRWPRSSGLAGLWLDRVRHASVVSVILNDQSGAAWHHQS